jgi:hypothetical protein
MGCIRRVRCVEPALSLLPSVIMYTASANHRYDKAVKQALRSDLDLLNKRIRD